MRIESSDSCALYNIKYNYFTNADVILSKTKCKNNADRLYETVNTLHNLLSYVSLEGLSWLYESARSEQMVVS